MKAMVLTRVGEALQLIERPTPVPGPGQVLVKITACGVCRTDLHLVDGELENPALPIIPGHEIVGHVAERGAGVTNLRSVSVSAFPGSGGRVAPAVFAPLGVKIFVMTLDSPATRSTAAMRNTLLLLPITAFHSKRLCPMSRRHRLLCAGLIGYRCLRFAGDARQLGIYGFGAAAHIIAQIAIHQGRQVFAFTRPGDKLAQEFARKLGAVWAGGSEETAPERLDAAIVFAPVGALVPLALKAVTKGGTVVLGGIHMSDIPAMPYAILWGERRLQSVANLTRQDAVDFLNTTKQMSISTRVEPMPLAEANTALNRLRNGNVTGAVVLVP